MPKIADGRPFAMVAALGIALAGCATASEGTDQTLTVQSEPPGAACTLSREGQQLAVIDATPSQLTLIKSGEDLTVSCSLAGYEDYVGTAPAMANPKTAGNMMAGGFIGIAVDSASGAAFRYPDPLTVLMTPHSFPTAEARDTHFARLREILRKQHVRANGRIEQRCSNQCGAQLQAERNRHQAAVADLETKRQNALVSGG